MSTDSPVTLEQSRRFRRGPILIALVFVVWIATLAAHTPWWIIGDESRGIIVSLQYGGIYAYWRAEPPELPLAQFVERLSDYRDYPIVLWSSRSSTGLILPTWAPLLLILVSPLIGATLWRTAKASSRRKRPAADERASV